MPLGTWSGFLTDEIQKSYLRGILIMDFMGNGKIGRVFNPSYVIST